MRSFLKLLDSVWRPHAGQREFLTSESRFKVLACGRRWGKTDACAVQVLAALHKPHPTQHLILAPTLAQANLLFDRVVELQSRFTGSKVKARSSPYPLLRVGDHTVMARSGHVPRSLRGHEATHIVVDEAAYLPESLVTEVAMPMLATNDGQITLISTPHGKNHFWKFFQMGQAREHNIWSRRGPSSESPLVSKSFLAVQRDVITERAYKVEYEAEFADSKSRVFKTECIGKCLVTSLPELDGPTVIGVDWARYADYTAVAVVTGDRDAAKLVALARFQGDNWGDAVGRVADQIGQHPGASVLCDATGVGDPVVEMLQRRLPDRRIGGAVFTSALKQSLIDGLVWMFERGTLSFCPHPALQRELEHFEALTHDTGRLKLGAANGFHDDLVIALSLAVSQLDTPYRPSIASGSLRKFSRSAKPQKPS